MGAAVAAAAGGAGGLVVVEGPGGIGKTGLLVQGRELAQAAGLRMLNARCSELERSFPFGAVRQLFEPLLIGAGAERSTLFGGAAALAAPLFSSELLAEPDDDALFSRLHGLYWLTANLATERPLLLCVDDAHWADEASLRFLAFLAHRIADLPAILLIASRPVDDPTADPAVGVLLTDPEARRLRPAPLSPAAVADVLGGRGERPAPAFVEACHDVTGGNPFLLRELAGEIAAEGLAPRDEAVQRVRSFGPAGVAAAVIGRLRRLDPAAIELARGLAILGDGADPRTVGAFAGLSEEQALAAARLLEIADVAGGADGLRFVHPIVRQSVYQDLTAVERGEGHAAAAAFLAARGDGPDAVVAHLLKAPPRADAATVAALTAAAERAEALGDPIAAADRLRRALAEPPPPAERATVLFALGRAAARAGLTEAAAHLEACIATDPEPDLHVRAAGVLAELRQFSGRPDLAADVLEAGIARLGADSDHGRRLVMHLVGPAHVSVPVRRRLLPRLLSLPAPEGPAQSPADLVSLASLACLEIMDRNDGHAAAGYGLRALEAPLPDPPDAGGRAALIVLTCALMGAERFEEADAILTASLDRGRRTGARASIASLASLRALVRYKQGRVADAESDALTAMEMLPQAHGAEMLANAGAAAAVLAGLERERPRASLEAILDEAPYHRDPDILPYSQILLARGALLAHHGEHEEALRCYEACDRDEPGWAAGTPSLVWWRSGAALSLSALGRDEQARRLAGEELELARASGLLRCTGIAEHAVALAGPEPERTERLRGAAATLEAAGAPLELARVLLDLGALLRRAGDRAAARDALDRAHELAERVGGTRTARIARQELRAIGARARATAGQGVAALTPSERRVADLAAGGRTNREIAQGLFLSEKTVETHLARVFRKLDVSSRRQLPALLAA